MQILNCILGMLNIVNQLFKIYFKVNKLHLCKPLIRAIESSSLKDRYWRVTSLTVDHYHINLKLSVKKNISFFRYPKSQQVTYKFYVGRKYMFDNDFKSAENYLTYAFEHCHRRCTANKRAILIYLIPVKMLLGHMPTQAILRK